MRFYRGTKQVDFPFENGMILMILFYFPLFSESAVTSVSDFCMPAFLRLDNRFRASPTFFASSTSSFIQQMFAKVL